MTTLVVLPEGDPATVTRRSSDPAEIAAHLAGLGVVFEQWHTDVVLPAGADQAAVLEAFSGDVARIQALGFPTVDVVRLAGDLTDETFLANAAAARAKFLAEHTHADDEIRFFVEGSGAFYLRVGGSIHIVVCEQGDYLSVPKDTKHWFDMGTKPRFTAIRFFSVDDGWVGNFTGDGIAARFPSYDELTAA